MEQKLRAEEMSCIDCTVVNCRNKQQSWPQFCRTTALPEEEIEETRKMYIEDEENHRIAVASATVESDFYGKMTRVEETMVFAQRIGARRIGIASCIGLLRESRTFAQILRFNGFEVYGIACKVGTVPKHEIGIPERCEEISSPYICNPIQQARLLNEAKTDLNVVVGLCVGHDSLFIKYSEAPVTVLGVKDRVLAHDPLSCLYLTHSFYKRLLLERTVTWDDETDS